MESLFFSLKTEQPRAKTYHAQNEATLDVFDCI